MIVMNRSNLGEETGPLAGTLVLELGHALAGPFAATLLGDFGAEVIKIERPGTGDSQRHMGPKHSGTGIWWTVSGRNKKSVVLDFKKKEGREIVGKLVKKADAVIENYRPGVLERLDLGWTDISSLNPSVIMLRVSGFGQSGPYSTRGGFGKIAEAFSGSTNLIGFPDRPPLHPGYSLGDAVCGLMGAYGVLLGLISRQQTGRGQLIDLPLYEPLFRLIEWQIPLFLLGGVNAYRAGTGFPFEGAFFTDICETNDKHHVVFSAATVAMLERLRALIRDEMESSDDLTNHSELMRLVRQWVSSNSLEYVMRKLDAADLVAGPINTPADLVNDPHIAARKNIVEVEHPEIGSIAMPSVVPSLSSTPGAVQWPGPSLGQHTEEVLRDHLEMDRAEVDRLLETGVIESPASQSGSRGGDGPS